MPVRDANLTFAARSTVSAADLASVTGLELGPMRGVPMTAEIRITGVTGNPTTARFGVYKCATVGGTYELVAVTEDKDPVAGGIYLVGAIPWDDDAFWKIALESITNGGGSINYQAAFVLAQI